MTPRVFGTKNYRKSEVPLVSGCGQPTLEATKTMYAQFSQILSCFSSAVFRVPTVLSVFQRFWCFTWIHCLSVLDCWCLIHCSFLTVFHSLQLSGAKVRRDTGEAFPNTKTLILCSLREEPVIYLNGRPFTVRKIGTSSLRDEDVLLTSTDNPLDNLSSFQGIDGDRVDKIETQLKNDILQECLKFRGLILVHSEPEAFLFLFCGLSNPM